MQGCFPPTSMPATLKRKKTAKNKPMKVKAKVKKSVRLLKRKTVKAKAKPKKKVMKRLSVTPTRKKPVVAKKPAPVMSLPTMHGKVTHYYDRIGVAIIDVLMPFSLGDFVRIRSSAGEFIQPVTSLQIDHIPVAQAQRGQVVGLRVTQKVPEGSVVLPM